MRRLTAFLSMALMTMALLCGSLLFGAGSASAATCTAYPAGCSSTVTTVPADGAAPYVAVAPAAAASTPSSTLAFTGTDVVGTAVVGGVLIVAGVAVVGATRRRRSA